MVFLSLKKLAMSVLGLFVSVAIGGSEEPARPAEHLDKATGEK